MLKLNVCLLFNIISGHVYMRPEVNSNRFEILLRGKIHFGVR